MSFEEKVTWVSTAVTLIVAGGYIWTVGARLGQAPFVVGLVSSVVKLVAYRRGF